MNSPPLVSLAETGKSFEVTSISLQPLPQKISTSRTMAKEFESKKRKGMHINSYSHDTDNLTNSTIASVPESGAEKMKKVKKATTEAAAVPEKKRKGNNHSP